MTIEQLLQKETLTTKDLFEYYGVETYEQLEKKFLSLTFLPYEELNIQDPELFTGFETIYNNLKKLEFNPIQERIMFNSVIGQGIFGIQVEEMNLFTRTLGVFKTAFFFDKIFKDIEIVEYYQNLYNEYISKRTSVSYLVTTGLEDLMKILNEKLAGFDPKNLEDYSERITSFIAELKQNLN